MTEENQVWPVAPAEEVVTTGTAPAPGSSTTRSKGNWLGIAMQEVLTTILPAILIAVVMHLFLAQSSIVYGESMQPNFYTDQRLIIEKISYHLHPPLRGDVVVLKDPDNGPLPLIKRVVGLPGERVTVAGGRVYIDGQALPEPYLDQSTPGGSRTWIVPPFHVFVMGDNRSNSRDSRYFGPVPTDSILGHAVFRYWPLDQLGPPR
jgi:signal peptidase I